MNILMISDSEKGGGAAISAGNLAQGLINRGNSVSRVVLFPDRQKPQKWKTIDFLNRKDLFNKAFARLLPSLPEKAKNIFANNRFRNILLKETPDFVNFHNILWGANLGYNLHMYKIASSYCNTFVTMHDMWNVIGYPYDFNGIKDKRILPQWVPPTEHLKGKSSTQMFKLRAKIFNNENIYFIAPSNWLKMEAISRFSFLKERIFVIPYGIDVEIYKPIEKKNARKLLGLPGGKINVLASAASLEHINKGFHILLETLKMRSNADIRLLIMGGDEIVPNAEIPGGVELISFGFVSDDAKKAIIYNSADFLAFPSFADNLPNTVIESISCGTPVVAFKTCGLPDLVKSNISGWISEEVSIESFRSVFEFAISDIGSGVDLSTTCRNFVLENFTMEKQAEAYEELAKQKQNNYRSRKAG